MDLLYSILSVIRMGMLVLLCIYGVVNRRDRLMHPIRLTLLIELLAIILIVLILKNKAHSFLLFNCVEFLDNLLYNLFFIGVLKSESQKNALWISLSVLIIIDFFYWFIPVVRIFEFTPILYGIQNLFVIFPCIFYFYERFQASDDLQIDEKPYFNIAVALLFFYSVTFPFFISYNTLYKVTGEVLRLLNGVNSVLTIFMYVLFLKSFLSIPKKHNREKLKSARQISV